MSEQAALVPGTPSEVTSLLAEVMQGNKEAEERLFAIVYRELHRLARGCMRRERPGHTLQTTALVNEAYVRLMGASSAGWKNRPKRGLTANTSKYPCDTSRPLSRRAPPEPVSTG